MKPLFKNLGLAVLLGMIGVYVFLELTGPRGVASLLEKRRAVKELQESNAALESENEAKKALIEELRDNRETQNLEIRKRYRLQAPNSVDFYLPESEAGSPAPGDSPEHPSRPAAAP